MCLGVERSIIEVLLQENSALSYRCCRCRVSPGRLGSSQDGGGLTQVLSIIGGLVSEVRKLTEKFSEGHGVRESSNDDLSISDQGRHPAPVRSSDIMAEVRELYEQDKRKRSVILRGVGNASCEEVKDIFSRVCTFLGVGNVELEDLTRAAPSVWRGKVLDVSKRTDLLSKAKNLKASSEFSRIYIQRDLTYRQRREVIAKRASFRQGTGANAVELGGSEGAAMAHEAPQPPPGVRRGAARGRGSTPSRAPRGRGDSVRGMASQRVLRSTVGGSDDIATLGGGDSSVGRGEGHDA